MTPRSSIWPATYAPRLCSGSAGSSQTSLILQRATWPSMHQMSRSSAVGASHCCSGPNVDWPSADCAVELSVPRAPCGACSKSPRSTIACAKASAALGHHLRHGVHDQDRLVLRQHGHRSRPDHRSRVGCGAQSENRTRDLRITNALLYRLSYLGALVAQPAMLSGVPRRHALRSTRASDRAGPRGATTENCSFSLPFTMRDTLAAIALFVRSTSHGYIEEYSDGCSAVYSGRRESATHRGARRPTGP